MMWLRNVLLIVLVLLVNTAFSAETEGKKMTDVIWIDVRTAEEYAGGHYKDAMLIPYDIIQDKIAAAVDDKNADIRVYCRTGRRSGVAKDVLTQMGYTQVTNEGGYEDILKRSQ